MLRLIHLQSARAMGAILIKDIDDGLSNKTAKNGIASGSILLGLGPTQQGNPHKSQLDGNVLGGADKSVSPEINYPKQRCYVPRRKINDPSTDGYIDLVETDRVLMSQALGDIKGFVDDTLISVTTFTPADVVAPVITWGRVDTGGDGFITITGTDFTSLLPDISKVIITGEGAVTLTATQIAAAPGGSFAVAAIVIPPALFTAVTVGLSSIQLWSDNHYSLVVGVTSAAAAPTLAAGAAILSAGTGDLAITGTGYTSVAPNTTSLRITRAGVPVITVPEGDLTIGGGGTTIAVDTLDIPGVLVGDTIQVRAHNQLTAARLIVGGP
jgi:hypothetical protein